jgi:hypothetical protein
MFLPARAVTPEKNGRGWRRGNFMLLMFVLGLLLGLLLVLL